MSIRCVYLRIIITNVIVYKVDHIYNQTVIRLQWNSNWIDSDLLSKCKLNEGR